MAGAVLAAVLLLLVGVVLDAPVAVVLAIVVVLLELVRAVWAREGLRGVSYVRRIVPDRIAWGEEARLTIEVWNRKALPLAWLRAEDDADPHVVVRERALARRDRAGPVLRNVWTLAPWERVSRHFHLGAGRRGVFALGPVTLSVGDLFAREVAVEGVEGLDRLLVRPRVVPTSPLRRRDAWGGTERARAGLAEDPSRFAGVREYLPGDPLRRVHPRASARLGRPMVKLLEPSHEREVLLVLDVQTTHGPTWTTSFESDEAEELCVIAASLARSLADERAAFGLAAAGYTGAESRFASVPVSEAPGQLERVLDLLARLSTHPSAPFERLLGRVLRTTRPGTTVAIITRRDPAPFLASLRRLEQAGCHVLLVACGPDAGGHARAARRAGLGAVTAALDGPWREATALVVAA